MKIKSPSKKAIVVSEKVDTNILTQKCNSFIELLNEIESVKDKKKALWKEIYENALLDRENANIMYRKLFDVVTEDPTQHAIHGTTIAKYLERMNKANDQLLKLAELLQHAEKVTTNSDNDIYSKLNNFA